MTVLARLYNIDGPTRAPHRTVIALIALAVFGNGPLFFAVQIATFLILFLAANTSYSDFPRLANFLARDRFAPRQFMNRGDRLAFSNGIIVLGRSGRDPHRVYQAELSRIINLYVVGVFTSFTLSQIGMVQHWRRRRKTEEPRWRRYAFINGLGAFTTFLVLVHRPGDEVHTRRLHRRRRHPVTRLDAQQDQPSLRRGRSSAPRA